MRLLAIDTSTSAIAVAVHDGSRVLDRESVLDPRGHAEQLAPAISRLLRRQDLAPAAITHVVCGAGPGPFTGLRVGLVTAVTFAWALGIPVGGLCSLDALARQVEGLEPGLSEFAVATDARRREVYWATYRSDGDAFVRVGGPRVDRPADIRGLPEGARASRLPVAGRGALLYPEAFGRRLDVLDVDAGALADLAVATLEADGVLPPPQPMYLRRPDAQPLPTAGRSGVAR